MRNEYYEKEIHELKEVILFLTDRIDQLEAMVYNDDEYEPMFEPDDDVDLGTVMPEMPKFDNPDVLDWTELRTEINPDDNHLYR